MKISVDNKEIFELSQTQEQVLKNEISADEFYEDMVRRLRWVLNHKYESCLKCLKDEWIPKLKAKGVKSVPLDDDQFAELVFSDPDYKCRKTRDCEAKKIVKPAKVVNP